MKIFHQKLLSFLSHVLLFAIMLSATNARAQSSLSPLPGENNQQSLRKAQFSAASNQLTYTVIKSTDNTYGYNILDKRKVLIHQPSVPGLQGNKGFSTKADAEKVAQLVINKMRNNDMPPSVTREELKSLKIISNR